MITLSTRPTSKSILDDIRLQSNDLYESRKEHKKDEVQCISESVIENFVRSDIICSSGEGIKCPNDTVSIKLSLYYSACADNGILFKDDIHTDIIDVFRWLNPNRSLFLARQKSSLFECFEKSYKNMRYLLSTFEFVNTPTAVDEERSVTDLYHDISEEVDLMPPNYQGINLSILKLLYEIVYQKTWDTAIADIQHIPHAEFIASNLRSSLSRLTLSDDIDAHLVDILTNIHRLYPETTTKDICIISSKVIEVETDMVSVTHTNLNFSYPWKHKIYTIYNSICESTPTENIQFDENEDIDLLITSAMNELDRLVFSDDAPRDISYANEAASRDENSLEKNENKAIKKSQKNEEKDLKKQQRVKKFNDTKNNIGKSWSKFKDKEEAIDNQLDKITRGLKDIVFDTNAKQKREEVLQGGKHWTPLQVLGRVIMGYAVFNYSKIGAIALLVTRHYTRKNCTKKERRKAIVELEHEIKIVEEKINDAQANGDHKAKYALMRTKNSLESALDQVRNSYKKMPDAELAGAKKALINVEVNSNGK